MGNLSDVGDFGGCLDGGDVESVLCCCLPALGCLMIGKVLEDEASFHRKTKKNRVEALENVAAVIASNKQQHHMHPSNQQQKPVEITIPPVNPNQQQPYYSNNYSNMMMMNPQPMPYVQVNPYVGVPPPGAIPYVNVQGQPNPLQMYPNNAPFVMVNPQLPPNYDPNHMQVQANGNES